MTQITIGVIISIFSCKINKFRAMRLRLRMRIHFQFPFHLIFLFNVPPNQSIWKETKMKPTHDRNANEIKQSISHSQFNLHNLFSSAIAPHTAHSLSIIQLSIRSSFRYAFYMHCSGCRVFSGQCAQRWMLNVQCPMANVSCFNVHSTNKTSLFIISHSISK